MIIELGDTIYVKNIPDGFRKIIINAANMRIPVQIVEIKRSHFVGTIQWTDELWTEYIKKNPDAESLRDAKWFYHFDSYDGHVHETSDDSMLNNLIGG